MQKNFKNMLDKIVASDYYISIKSSRKRLQVKRKEDNKMTRAELENKKKITIKSFSEYDPEKCNNGGGYGFWTEYDRTSDDSWEVSYGTTADLEFCPCCGEFADHYDYDNEEYSCGEFDTVTTDTLLEKINNSNEDEFVEVK